ncbi:hypothetical protein C0995_012913, partial [Termitomyces sp. Mi166
MFTNALAASTKNHLQSITNTGKTTSTVALTDQISPSTMVLPNAKACFYVYALTGEEKKILDEHRGFYQCCHIYVDHRAAACPDKGKVLSLAEYEKQKLTLALVEATLKAHEKGKASSSLAPVTVVAVFEESSDEQGSSNTGDKYVLPKHMTYSCFVSAPSIAPTLVENALIDSSAPPAMISSTL